ncbi:protein PTST homolog 3, chloroplastic isoform X2 [Rosa chinensis]|uniref:protein PTST homolog 3, chloroplastic isoform X2 n=1 Tax=Rosa chinensis TaxID=74649 RepID=UPI001AD8DD21|nr:protein PTST homolog 3, chloroplastic isoform X2 [Rosa chinensis]
MRVMATLSQFPAFPSLLSPKLVFFDPQQHQLKLRRCTAQHPPSPVHFAVRASSSVKKSRRKVKSNEELCNELMEFIAAVGLPQGHVPSMKELSQNGRNDLAYIVRRRGYKLIRELLADSTESESTDVDGNADNFIAENDDGQKDIVTGQYQEVNDVVEEFSSLSEVSILESSSEALVTDPVLKHDDDVEVPVESLADSLLQDTSSGNLEGHGERVDSMEGNGRVSNVPVIESHVNSSKIGTAFNSDHHTPVEICTNSSLDVLEDLSLPTTIPIKQNDSDSPNIGWDLNSDGQLSVPIDSGTHWSSDKKALHRDQDGKVDNMADEVALSTKASVMEEEDHHSSSDLELNQNSDDDSDAPVKYPVNLSLEEKVTEFMQNGDLDALEDNIYGVSIESDAEEIKSSNKFGNAEEVQLRTPTSEYSKHMFDGSDATSEQILSPTAVDPPLGDATSLADSRSTLSDKNLDVKTSEREDQHDISRLKSMLHQKELELSRLKEQIEKEQHALSVLQANAETAINEAQKLICEKDAELLAAEENLSGLVEVS